MRAGEIASKAAELVDGDRATAHGDKAECFERIADFWSVYLGMTVTGDQVATMMCLLKIARSQHGAVNLDDYVDLAGYAAIAGELVDG